MQEFFLIRGSVNPPLRVELINDGRYDFKKSFFDNVLQDSTVTFSMKNNESGILKVGKQKANIVLAKSEGCEEKYILQYKVNRNKCCCHGSCCFCGKCFC